MVKHLHAVNEGSPTPDGHRDVQRFRHLLKVGAVLEAFVSVGIDAVRTLYCMGKCYFFLREDPKALEAFNSLVHRYPDSPYGSKAEAFLKDIEKGRFTRVSRFFRAKERVFYMFGYE